MQIAKNRHKTDTKHLCLFLRLLQVKITESQKESQGIYCVFFYFYSLECIKNNIIDYANIQFRHKNTTPTVDTEPVGVLHNPPLLRRGGLPCVLNCQKKNPRQGQWRGRTCRQRAQPKSPPYTIQRHTVRAKKSANIY